MLSTFSALTRKSFRPTQGSNPIHAWQRVSQQLLSTAPDAPEKTVRPRRSLLSVPGSEERKIQKAAGLSADSIVLDLEDGVALDKKDVARELVSKSLQDRSMFQDRTELCVRINAFDTGALAISDLEAIVPCPALQGIVIPKVETPADIELVSGMIKDKATSSDVRILAAIESAKGMLNLRDIAATAESCSLDALIFASEDYCADLELIRTEHATEMLWARSELVTTAKAYGLQAIDMVHIDFRNLPGLAEECQRGRELGFTGKQAIHPAQLDTIHATFVPSAKDIEFAKKCVEEYEAATKVAGKGACVVNGIVVDAPVYKWAVKILKRAQQAGLV
eukprot:Nitzschia sp. Nitz4//scaffold27_size158506//97333//98340//NITZ4_002608-RA/size158506-processed-gene-0.22-mRNA-1//1//CDS//3329545512//1443//frame0